MTTTKQSEGFEMTYHICSKFSGEVFATSNDWEFLMREMAYLTSVGYGVELVEAK